MGCNRPSAGRGFLRQVAELIGVARRGLDKKCLPEEAWLVFNQPKVFLSKEADLCSRKRQRNATSRRRVNS